MHPSRIDPLQANRSVWHEQSWQGEHGEQDAENREPPCESRHGEGEQDGAGGLDITAPTHVLFSRDGEEKVRQRRGEQTATQERDEKRVHGLLVRPEA